MKDDNRNVVWLLWAVIAVLIVGILVGGFLLVKKTDDLQQTNDELTGDNASLNNQVKQLKASPSPSATPTPSLSTTPTPSPGTPSPRP